MWELIGSSALVLCGMVLVERHWETDRAALERTFASMKERKWPICITPYLLTLTAGLTMFPEGTRLKPKTLELVLSISIFSDYIES